MLPYLSRGVKHSYPSLSKASRPAGWLADGITVQRRRGVVRGLTVWAEGKSVPGGSDDWTGALDKRAHSGEAGEAQPRC